MNSAQLRAMADSVVTAACCMSQTAVKAKGSLSSTKQDDLTRSRDARMAALLGFASDPTRAALLQELKNKSVVELASPSVQRLYECLEGSLTPAALVKQAVGCLGSIEGKYQERVKSIVCRKALGQLGAIYSTMTIAGLMDLVGGLGFDFRQVRQVLYDAAADGEVKVRIDLKSECLRFEGKVRELRVRGGRRCRFVPSRRLRLPASHAFSNDREYPPPLSPRASLVEGRRGRRGRSRLLRP